MSGVKSQLRELNSKKGKLFESKKAVREQLRGVQVRLGFALRCVLKTFRRFRINVVRETTN